MIYHKFPFPGKLIKLLYKKKLSAHFKIFLLKFTLFGKSNLLRIRNIYKLDIKNNIKILDLGCGTGETSCLLAKSYPNADVYGYDLSLESLKYANKLKNLLNIKNVKFLNKNIFKKKNYFDFIHLSGVLHHIKNEHIFFRRVQNLLKKKSIYKEIYFGVYGRKFLDEKYLRQFIKKTLKIKNPYKCIDFLKEIQIDRSRELLKLKNENIYQKFILSIIKFDFSYFGYVFFPHNKNSNNIDAYFHYYVKYYTPESLFELLKKINYKKCEFVLPSTKYDNIDFYKKFDNKKKFLFLDAIGQLPSYILRIKC